MNYPPYPSHIGQKRSLKDINGNPGYFTIIGEMIRPEINHPEKLIYLQRIQWHTGNCELRLCYYMLGVKGRSAGKWVFGQYATFIQPETLRAIIDEAQSHGWI
jgi:hypothetical protein